jgi:hypothetical protein
LNVGSSKVERRDYDSDARSPIDVTSHNLKKATHRNSPLTAECTWSPAAKWETGGKKVGLVDHAEKNITPNTDDNER